MPATMEKSACSALRAAIDMCLQMLTTALQVYPSPEVCLLTSHCLCSTADLLGVCSMPHCQLHKIIWSSARMSRAVQKPASLALFITGVFTGALPVRMLAGARQRLQLLKPFQEVHSRRSMLHRCQAGGGLPSCAERC